MKSLVIGLLVAPVLAVIGIASLEPLNSNETILALQWLLFAFVPLDLLALVFATVAWLWNVRRAGLRRAVRAVLLSTYVLIGPLGYLYEGAQHKQQMASYDPSDDCRVLFGDCVPNDGRFSWLVAWTILGFISWAAARLRARRMRTNDYWYGGFADQRSV